MKPLKVADIQLDGTSLIEASAGTGKTWTIAALYMRLLLERSLLPEQILVVTYTKAATAELKERIRQRILATLELFAGHRQTEDELDHLLIAACPDHAAGHRLLTRALYSFDAAAIFTIHGFCQRALGDHAFESRSLFDTEMVSDQSALLNAAADDFWRTHVMTAPTDLQAGLMARGYTPQALLEPIKSHCLSPHLKIIPDPEQVDFTAAVKRRQTLFGQASDLWRAARGEIIALLLAPGLNQRSYKPQQVEKAALLLDGWFAGSPAAACDKLALFSTENLRDNTNKNCQTPSHPFFDLCHLLLQACGEAGYAFDQALIRLHLELRQWLARELPRRKRSENLRCFDDLLLDLHHALSGETGAALAVNLREQYRAALIDEFQDTDRIQWNIFRMIASAPSYPLLIIGDPKQAIYSFRGADIHAYLAAGSSIAKDMRWTLDTNRRSVKPLVDAVNALFKNNRDPFLCNGIGFHPVLSGRHTADQLLIDGQPDNTPLRFWICKNNDDQPQNKTAVRRPIAESVAAEILRLLTVDCRIRLADAERPVTPADVAVLVRSHSQACIIQEALSSLAIPSIQHGNQTIFETFEALDLLRILRAVNEPGNESLVKEAMLGGLLGVNVNTLDQILHSDTEWDLWLGRFRQMDAAFRTGGMIALTSVMLEECGARQFLLGLKDGERRMTNLQHCVELIHQSEAERPASLAGCIDWLESRINRRQEDDTALLRLETDSQAVRIVTIHASKGLQYPIVFIPFAWDAPPLSKGDPLFHDRDGGMTLDLGSPERDAHLQAARLEQQAEAARLLYVAMTRAEFRCYVVWGAIRQAGSTPLYRLLHAGAGKSLKDFNDQSIMADIAALSATAPGIGTEAMPLAPEQPVCFSDTRMQNIPPPPQFLGTIHDEWRISSFSSLTAHGDRLPQPRDVDALQQTDSKEIDSGQISSVPGIFDFPRGAQAGTCLHELFEKLDYANAAHEPMEALARQSLQRNGFDTEWLPVITGMATHVLQAPLLLEDRQFCLNRLKPSSWVTEMEFYLPLEQISASRLKAAFDGQLSMAKHGCFPELLASLHIQESRGMLTGFIDMVFEHQGRYYIVDWKSNHLGSTPACYGEAGLREAICANAYTLQYHLYTLALDRLLASRIPGYDYDKHFGGAIYVFLRGVDACGGRTGIYRDRPTSAFIRNAHQLLFSPSAC
ncbi:MAG TPA: exodeoxyribonuclease V subunit beta [Deltaproteobacteria bacterium]|nr:exodeoxyribonuclease V subunit beta [Deltaproteobacteria bacterium]HQB37899.1 exodeoxyribonuclease V subunit beta [Deltaproteobacteria bacterium]